MRKQSFEGIIAIDDYVRMRQGRKRLFEDASGAELTSDGSVLHLVIPDTTSCDKTLVDEVINRTIEVVRHNSRPYQVIPRSIREGFSLLPGQKRLTLTVATPLTATLERKGLPILSLTQTRLEHSISYEDVARIIDDPSDPLHQQIVIGSYVAAGLFQIRESQGLKGLVALPSNGITNDEGLIRKIEPDKKKGYMFVGEFTGQGNSSVGEFAKAQTELDVLYSHQEPLIDVNTIDLRKFLEEFGGQIDPMHTASMRRYLGTEVRRARYSVEPKPYQSLGVNAHARVSSVLYRTVDLLNSWSVIAFLKGEPPPFPKDVLHEVALGLNARLDIKERNRLKNQALWRPDSSVLSSPITLLASWAQEVLLSEPQYEVRQIGSRRWECVCTFHGYRITTLGDGPEEARWHAAKWICENISLG